MDAINQAWVSRYMTAVCEKIGWDARPLPGEGLVADIGGLRLMIADPGAGDPEYVNVYAVFGIDTDDADTVRAVLSDPARDPKLVKTILVPGAFVLSVEMIAGLPDCLPTVDYLTAALPRAARAIIAAAGSITTAIELAGIQAATQARGNTQGHVSTPPRDTTE